MWQKATKLAAITAVLTLGGGITSIQATVYLPVQDFNGQAGQWLNGNLGWVKFRPDSGDIQITDSTSLSNPAIDGSTRTGSFAGVKKPFTPAAGNEIYVLTCKAVGPATDISQGIVGFEWLGGWWWNGTTNGGWVLDLRAFGGPNLPFGLTSTAGQVVTLILVIDQVHMQAWGAIKQGETVLCVTLKSTITSAALIGVLVGSQNQAGLDVDDILVDNNVPILTYLPLQNFDGDAGKWLYADLGWIQLYSTDPKNDLQVTSNTLLTNPAIEGSTFAPIEGVPPQAALKKFFTPAAGLPTYVLTCKVVAPDRGNSQGVVGYAWLGGWWWNGSNPYTGGWTLDLRAFGGPNVNYGLMETVGRVLTLTFIVDQFNMQAWGVIRDGDTTLLTTPKMTITNAAVDGVVVGSQSQSGLDIDDIQVNDVVPELTATPAFVPDWGFIAPGNIAINCETPGAAIHYTTDGSIPTLDSPLYQGPVAVNHTLTLKARAWASGIESSAIKNADYFVTADGATLDRGHQRIIYNGLQIQAWAFTSIGCSFDVTRWQESNFTSVNILYMPYDNLSYFPETAVIPWSGLMNEGGELNTDLPRYIPNLVSLQLGDEQDLTPEFISSITDHIAAAKRAYPATIIYTNQYGSQATVAQLQSYMQAAQPDMLMFDEYVFGIDNASGVYVPLGGSPTTIYRDMAKYRLLGLAGNDGTGTIPIPYAFIMQTFKGVPGVPWDRFPSDSEMRLCEFAAWTFGFKMVSAFVYEYDTYLPGQEPSLFVGPGTSSPTAAFYQLAETNRQSRNLGPALVRLLSTDLRMIMGQRPGGPANLVPEGVTGGIDGADPYITGITATNLGTLNEGLPGDVILGFFKPLRESFDGDNYSNQRYFMITNGLTDAIGTAAETRQNIRITFNFGSSGINNLQRINRNTGRMQIALLDHDNGTNYHLDLTLDGGTGDLFKYNTGAPFIGARAAGDVNRDGVVDANDLSVAMAAMDAKPSSENWSLDADLDADSEVTSGDLALVLANMQ